MRARLGRSSRGTACAVVVSPGSAFGARFGFDYRLDQI